MIGLHPVTGATITGIDQLRSRFMNMATTFKGSRERSRLFGSDCRKNLDNNLSDSVLIQIQSRAIAGVADPNNGLLDFTITQCKATRTTTGAKLTIMGVWDREAVSFEVPVNV